MYRRNVVVSTVGNILSAKSNVLVDKFTLAGSLAVVLNILIKAVKANNIDHFSWNLCAPDLPGLSLETHRNKLGQTGIIF